MAKQSSKETLAEKISDILNAAPASLDPEDDENDDTRAKIATTYLEDDKDVFEDEIPRRKLSSTIEDYDERYAGKKLSRKDLEDDSSDQNDTVEADSNTDESEADQGSDLDISEEESENSAEESEDFVEGSGEEDDFKHINESSVSKETSKGVCVKNQISIWESLLEMRIQLQKCLITSNKMPQHDTYKQIRELNDSDFIKNSAETKHNVSHLLDKLLLLQSLVLKQYPETKSLSSETVKDHESDEEIPSDTDEEIKSDNEETASDKPKEVVRKRKQSDYERDISETHSKYRKYRDSVIQKWNDKTKVLLAKNKDSTSVLAQIDYLLSDREKLLNRTRTKRSSYEILGKPAAEGSAETVSYDPEIFDDDDFYHQILRELIEFRSADLTDPVQLGRQWVQLQSLRSKMKRNIDTRATKGRKIRYAVHSKLVNFMAPIDDNKWSDEAKTDLFKSLFGGKNNKTTVKA